MTEPTTPARCNECSCQTGGGEYCYRHKPYLVTPLKDGSFYVDRNGRQHVLVEPMTDAERATLTATVARLQVERGACDFCESRESDHASMLKVCPTCWNGANNKSGWMQRALAAESAVARLEQENRELSIAFVEHHLGDNHHNALGCPHCNPQNLALVEPAALTEAQAAMEKLDVRWIAPDQTLVEGIQQLATERAEAQAQIAALRAQVEQLPHWTTHDLDSNDQPIEHESVKRDDILALLPDPPAPTGGPK